MKRTKMRGLPDKVLTQAINNQGEAVMFALMQIRAQRRVIYLLMGLDAVLAGAILALVYGWV